MTRPKAAALITLTSAEAKEETSEVGEGETGRVVRTREEKTTDSELVERKREETTVADAGSGVVLESRVAVRVIGVERV